MKTKTTLALSVALALGACASAPPPNPQLETARTAVQTAESDPNVSRYAQLDLEQAKKDLAVAESAYQAKQLDQVSQPAYLATQNARLAQSHAAAKADDAKVAQGQTERDRIMLQARTREAENAKLQADQARLSAEASKQEAAAAQAELDQLKAQQTNRGTVITLGDVLFDTGMAQLKPGASRKMDQLAQYLTEHPDRRVQVDGFTDSVGTDSYNEELSQRRADAVKMALNQRGIDPTRVSTTGYGKAYPVASNSDSGGRQMNRRVEVVIGGGNNAQIAPRSGGY